MVDKQGNAMKTVIFEAIELDSGKDFSLAIIYKTRALRDQQIQDRVISSNFTGNIQINVYDPSHSLTECVDKLFLEI